MSSPAAPAPPQFKNRRWLLITAGVVELLMAVGALGVMALFLVSTARFALNVTEPFTCRRLEQALAVPGVRGVAPVYLEYGLSDWKNMVNLFLHIARRGHEYEPGHKLLKQRLENRFSKWKKFL